MNPSSFTEVAKRWESASTRMVTHEQCFELMKSSDFYPCNSYCWDGQPPFVFGEVGYDDVSKTRILVPDDTPK